jgi:hypothetical protein
MFNLEAIGKVHSPLKNIEDCPLQEQENAPPVEIEIFPRFQEAAKSIKPGDKLILFTWLNLGDRHVLQRHLPAYSPRDHLTGLIQSVSTSYRLRKYILKIRLKFRGSKYSIKHPLLTSSPASDRCHRVHCSFIVTLNLPVKREHSR